MKIKSREGDRYDFTAIGEVGYFKDNVLDGHGCIIEISSSHLCKKIMFITKKIY